MSAVGPYGHAAAAYWNAGWKPIVLPYAAKTPPPDSFTGRHPDPSYADVSQWIEHNGEGNIALRLPLDVVGIDVDHHDGTKAGAVTLERAQAAWGALPPTWLCTSRTGMPDGIRFYRVPSGLRWRQALFNERLGSGDIDIIRHRHRYAVVWPSLHPSMAMYRWVDPSGAIVEGPIPTLDSLTALPQSWVDMLSDGLESEPDERADVDGAQANEWLDARNREGTACYPVEAALKTFQANVGSGAHEAMLAATRTLAGHADAGHVGTGEAIIAVRDGFFATMAARPANEQRSGIAQEWSRALTGAVALAAADGAGPRECGCGGVYPSITDLSVPPLPAPQADPQTPTETEATPEATHTSWWFTDLAGALSGTSSIPPPEYLRRTDGAALFYAGKVNSLMGQGETGKSFLAYAVILETLAAGAPGLVIDFEDTAVTAVSRMRSLGASDEQLSRFYYIRPDESLFSDAAAGDLRNAITTAAPAVIVVDGVNPALSLMGLKINENDDINRFTQTFLHPLARTGAAVIVIDHTVKDPDNRSKGAMGGAQKRNMVDGCSLLVEVVRPFARGHDGEVRLRIDKDRPGRVRETAGGAELAGIAEFVSDTGTGGLSISIRPSEAAQTFKPTRLMEKISDFMAKSDVPLTKNAIEQAVTGKATNLRTALDHLVNEGYVETVPHSGHTRFALIKPYNPNAMPEPEADALVRDWYREDDDDD